MSPIVRPDDPLLAGFEAYDEGLAPWELPDPDPAYVPPVDPGPCELVAPAAPVRVDELDATVVLGLLEQTVSRRRAAEVDDLLLVLQWATLHGSDPRLDPEHRNPDGTPGRLAPGADKLVQIGGDGTPLVRELSLCELGIARRVHTLSARSTLADALDLAHRLPRTWQVVLDLACEPWVARRVAAISRVVPAESVHVVDTAVAAAIDGHGPSKVLELAAAKVIEADPTGHAARAADREQAYVALSRTDEHGMRTFVARVEAGEAVWVDALVDRVADILTHQWHAAHADDPDADEAMPTRDQFRAEAFGWTGRPAEVLALLCEHTGDLLPPDLPTEPAGQDAEEASETDTETEPPCRAMAFPADLLDALRSRDLTGLRPRTVLYLHLHQAALDGSAPTVARAEGLGPCDLDRLTELIGARPVTVTPVLDLADQVSTAAYEFPEHFKERIHLLHDGDAFPHATGRSRNPRRVDIDHPVPWDPGGPPDQTSTSTGQPLSRTAHRAKTHLGYTATPRRCGGTLWRTPHGLTRLVDHRGTHHAE